MVKVKERNPPIRFRANIPTSWIQLTLIEGKNRQVRKMCAKIGYPVLRLLRVSIEDLLLGKMEIGDIQEMGKKEIYHSLNIQF